jgi:hypothetical protein
MSSNHWLYPFYPMARPLEVADITYAYTPTGQVDSMRYPNIHVWVQAKRLRRSDRRSRFTLSNTRFKPTEP